MLQSTDPENLSDKEDLRGDTWISLGRENRINFVDGLGVEGDENGRYQVRGGMEGDITEMDNWNCWG